MKKFPIAEGGSTDLHMSLLRMILTGLFMLFAFAQSNSFRIKDIDRVTSGKSGKDACTLSLALDWDQFEEICPIRQLATLKKQISDAKRLIKNSTELEMNFHQGLLAEQHERVSLSRRMDVLYREVNSCNRELLVVRSALANISQFPIEQATPAPPIIIQPTPDFRLERLSFKLNRELERRVKMLESKIKAFENIPLATSCGDIRRWGVFPIKPEGAPAPVDTYCMREWTVIAKRMDGSVNFLRNWQDYKHGFGNVSGEYWLGNDNIHYLTTQGRYRLRIDITDWNDTQSFSMYDTFYIEGEDEFYRLHIGNHTGPLRNSLYREYDDNKSPFSHHGQYFSTYDMDNDNSNAHCAEVYSGGYWYNDCYASNLNGPYCTESEAHSRCMVWWGDGGRMILQAVTWRIKELPDMN